MTEDYCYKQLLNEIFEGIYFVDINRTITFWNKEAEKITGFTSSEVIGKYCYSNLLRHVDNNGQELCINGCPLHETTKDGIIRKANLFLHHKSGHRVPVSVKTIPLYENQKIVGAAQIFIDTSEKKDIEEEIEKYRALAMKDQLTSLPNRRYIETYLELKINEFKSFNWSFGVAFIDIDHFKIVNDTYGHEVGDEVLKMVARTFVHSARGNDLIGRWGGEEFIAVFTNCNEEALIKLVEKIRMLIANSMLKTNDAELKITISIGATMVKNDDTIESIIKRVDSLMYQSKENGRNRVTIG